jgi:hypothetical protein
LSPRYVAVIVFAPVDVNLAIQLPLPAERIMVQFVLAPLIFTTPVGVLVPPVTVTLTFTFPLRADGSGLSPVMVVVVPTGLGSADPHKLNGDE